MGTATIIIRECIQHLSKAFIHNMSIHTLKCFGLTLLAASDSIGIAILLCSRKSRSTLFQSSSIHVVHGCPERIIILMEECGISTSLEVALKF